MLLSVPLNITFCHSAPHEIGVRATPSHCCSVCILFIKSSTYNKTHMANTASFISLHAHTSRVCSPFSLPLYTKVSLCCAQISRDANKIKNNRKRDCSGIEGNSAEFMRKRQIMRGKIRQNETISCTTFANTAPEITELQLHYVRVQKHGCMQFTWKIGLCEMF